MSAAANFAEFKDAARQFFGTVSGTPEAARVAVRNVTTFRKVVAMAEVFGGTVAADTGRYPQLMRIDFTQGATLDGGAR